MTGPNPVYKRRFRLNLRTALVLVAFFAATLGWFARQASIQRNSVAAIRRDGGWVVYDGSPTWSVKPKMGSLKPDHKRDWWTSFRVRYRVVGFLTGLLDIDLIDHPVSAQNGPLGRTEEAISQLGQLRRLDRLDLRGNGDRVSLIPLGNLSHMQILTINDVKLDADTLKPLKHLKSLKRLEIIDGNITDEALEPIESLTNLETLVLESSPLTSRVLARLSHLPRLKHLLIGNLSDYPSGLDKLHRDHPNLRIITQHGEYK